MPDTDTRLLRLHEDDNILIVLTSLVVGEVLEIGDQSVSIGQSLLLGHKLAACDIARGDAVLKAGVKIGRASQKIRLGDHVHTHNLSSDYTPTHDRSTV